MFVDIHNHILPGIDDGAPTMGHAVEMARQAVACGTDTLIATPHQTWASRLSCPSDWVRGMVAELQSVLDKERVPLKIVPGVEIRLTADFPDLLISGDLLTLGDAGTWALIEPPFDALPKDGLSNLRRVREAGFQVVLAHPERNKVIQQDLTFVQQCADLGLAFQVTTGCILGRFSETTQRTAEAILKRHKEWPIVIASDAHDLHDRTTGMMALARDRAATIVGEAAAQEMVDSRPRSFITPV